MRVEILIPYYRHFIDLNNGTLPKLKQKIDMKDNKTEEDLEEIEIPLRHKTDDVWNFNPYNTERKKHCNIYNNINSKFMPYPGNKKCMTNEQNIEIIQLYETYKKIDFQYYENVLKLFLIDNPTIMNYELIKITYYEHDYIGELNEQYTDINKYLTKTYLDFQQEYKKLL